MYYTSYLWFKTFPTKKTLISASLINSAKHVRRNNINSTQISPDTGRGRNTYHIINLRQQSATTSIDRDIKRNDNCKLIALMNINSKKKFK